MKIEFEGRAWQVDVDDLSLQQAVVITGKMGGSLTAWEKALTEIDDPGWLPAMQCLYWLMRQQDGDRLAIGDIDFAVLKYSHAVVEALEREGSAAAPEDPTPPPVTPAAVPGEAEPRTAAVNWTGSTANPI